MEDGGRVEVLGRPLDGRPDPEVLLLEPPVLHVPVLALELAAVELPPPQVVDQVEGQSGDRYQRLTIKQKNLRSNRETGDVLKFAKIASYSAEATD